ncbi:MAG: DNA-binding response regulator [Gemmatales bacterium]|nr:MAG: DNA-binding response regulator [Gemmatales bacterium]
MPARQPRKKNSAKVERESAVRILVVEDNKPLVRALEKVLAEEGFAVDVATDGEEADYKVRSTDYDVVLLDLMLPHIDGFELLKRWRKKGVQAHILVITARGEIEDKVRGLDLGGDDYLVKPFEIKELLARIRALIRRRHQVKNPVLRIFDLEIDTAKHIVRRGGKVIHLTPREYALLQFLAFHQGEVVTRTMIWEHLYNEDDENTSNVVDVYIRYLRQKIDEGFDPPIILTRRGEGYLLRGNDE